LMYFTLISQDSL